MTLFQVTKVESRTFLRVATPRDPAVTEFVRVRMREILASEKPGTQGQLAQRIGVSPAMLSSFTRPGSTMGIGGRSIEGFARFLGFRDQQGRGDPDALRLAAYDWFREQSPKLSARSEEPAVHDAIARVKALQPWVTDEHIRTILHRFTHEDFNDRDVDYWFMTIIAEAHQDTLREQRRQASVQNARQEHERAGRKIQGAFKSAATVKRQAEEARAVAELEAVPEAPKVVPPVQRRKKA